MSYDIAIRVNGLSKCYQIYENPRDRLLQFIFPRIQRVLGIRQSRYHKEFWALRNVSFEVRRGETVGIIGHNGSGKSTLLQLICGILTPTSGYVEIRGRIAALLELGSGFNPQFTGRENVFLYASLLGLTEQETARRFDEIVSFADIGDFIDQPIKTYSSGMVVRLAFAVQTQIDPDVLIVDEALAVGDERFQRKCFARMETLKAKGTSIIFVSHSATQIIDLCEKTLFLNHGERLLFATPLIAVRAYQKLIYARDEEKNDLVKLYKKIDSDDMRHSEGEYINTEKAKDQVSMGTVPVSNYDSNLTPESTIIYPSSGAEIEQIAILNRAGDQVNILVSGEEYVIVLKGRFSVRCKEVHFGVHIRAINGTVVSGQRYPALPSTIEEIEAGKGFSISFGFRMDLLAGTYFIGGGIWSNQDPECIHRVLDKTMFRVEKQEVEYSFGLYDACYVTPTLELS
jgi:lipopolysaccharide transport system ATP-binding protein